MICRFALVAALAAMLSGCGGGGHAGSLPSRVPSGLVPSSVPLGAPAPLSGGTAPARPGFLNTAPPPPPADDGVRHTRGNGPHAAFFNGEVPLANSVYYLALPNGNVFGYYSYLSNSQYIYHFDLGYEYVVDAKDGQGGMYMYDFASQHWWYTGAQYPFPYIYDFTLNAYLYYFPDTANAGHYTTKPRYFNDFGNGAIITLPSAQITPGSLSFTATGGPAAKQFTISESGYQGTFSVDASACGGVASVNGVLGNTYSVVPYGQGTCNVLVGDSAGGRAALAVHVTLPGGVQHLYLGNASPSSAGFVQYTLPVSAAATPNFTIATGRTSSVGVDSNGNVAAADSSGNIGFYPAPLSAASTATAVFHYDFPPSGSQGIVFTGSGDLYISVSKGAEGFTHPFVTGGQHSSFIDGSSVQFEFVNGMAMDAAQNIYLTSATATTTNLRVYAPPYTGVPLVTAAISGRYRQPAVTATQLFVGSDGPGAHRVDVYTLPITAQSTPTAAITTGIHTPEAVAVDANGNLYVANFLDSDVTEYAPPFSASSAPVVTLPVPSGFYLYSMAIGK